MGGPERTTRRAIDQYPSAQTRFEAGSRVLPLQLSPQLESYSTGSLLVASLPNGLAMIRKGLPEQALSEER